MDWQKWHSSDLTLLSLAKTKRTMWLFCALQSPDEFLRTTLGISVEALRIGALEVNLQSLPKSAQQSGPSERAGSLLCAT